MKIVGNLTIATPSDREIAITRVYGAPRKLVSEAYIRPDLLKRWLGVFGNWTLAVCEFDPKVGGAYRYEWHGKGGVKMGVSGTILEFVAPERIVTTEKFDDPWYEGEGLVMVTFVEQAGKTTATTTLRYATKEIRDQVLQSPMEVGLGASYDNLAELLAKPA